MADNCYCSVQFKTGEELDEALLKAKTACDEAEKAVAAKEAIVNMEVCCCDIPAGSDPTVEKTVGEDGRVTLTFGLPAKNGDDYVTPQMYGAKGDGVTDDTVAVQSALDNGGVIYFPSGVYKVTRQLTTTKPCKIMMFKAYPSAFWRSKDESGRYDYPIILKEDESDYQDEKGWDFGARIDCYPSSEGEQYGLLIGDGCEVDGLFMRAMGGFNGVLLKYDGLHSYGTANDGEAIICRTYPSQTRLQHIQLDCDRHNEKTAIPESMFDFRPAESWFHIIDDVVVGQLREYATYGFRSIIDEDAVWANSVRITNLALNGSFDYPLFICGSSVHTSTNWIFEGLTVQTRPYNLTDFEKAMVGHKAVITLKNMNYCFFTGCYIWDLYAAKFEKLFDCDNISNVSCVGCSDEFYNGTKNLVDYGIAEEAGIETVLADRLKQVAEDANVQTLSMNTTSFEDGSNRITVFDSHGNSVYTDIPPLTLSDEQLAVGINNWMDDNAMPKEAAGKNKFNVLSSDNTLGLISHTSGRPVTDDRFFLTHYIPVKTRDVVRNANLNNPLYPEGFRTYELYEFDKDGRYLRYAYNADTAFRGFEITNADTAFIRLANPIDRIFPDKIVGTESEYCVTINNFDTSYEPYEVKLVGGLKQYFMLQSPNGTKYSISVTDDGQIVGEKITT